jgi:hypothetical protein
MTLEEALRTLGLHYGGVDESTLRDRFRELSLKYHPDRPTGDHKKMARISAAYSVVKKQIDNNKAKQATNISSSFTGSQINVKIRTRLCDILNPNKSFRATIPKVNRKQSFKFPGYYVNRLTYDYPDPLTERIIKIVVEFDTSQDPFCNGFKMQPISHKQGDYVTIYSGSIIIPYQIREKYLEHYSNSGKLYFDDDSLWVTVPNPKTGNYIKVFFTEINFDENYVVLSNMGFTYVNLYTGEEKSSDVIFPIN